MRTHDEIVLNVKTNYHFDKVLKEDKLEYVNNRHIEDVLKNRWGVAEFYLFRSEFNFLKYYMVRFSTDDTRWFLAKSVYETKLIILSESYEATSGELAVNAYYAKIKYDETLNAVKTAIACATHYNDLKGNQLLLLGTLDKALKILEKGK